MFESVLERLVKTVSAAFGSEIEEARASYFLRCGEPFQDEASYELRLRNFIEWYLFDRPLALGLTPYEAFMADASKSTEDRDAFRPYRDQVHSLFEVLQVGQGGIEVRDVWTLKTYPVGVEVTLGYDPGAVVETRIVPFEGKNHATHTHVYHNRESARYILKRAAKIRKEKRIDLWMPFVMRVNYLQLKAERYKHVESNKIYREISEFGREAVRAA
jgi:hypothetical protein